MRARAEHGADIVGIISLEQHEHGKSRYEGPIEKLAASRDIPLVETKWMKCELNF